MRRRFLLLLLAMLGVEPATRASRPGESVVPLEAVVAGVSERTTDGVTRTCRAPAPPPKTPPSPPPAPMAVPAEPSSIIEAWRLAASPRSSQGPPLLT